MAENLRILIAEDHHTVREGLKLIVNEQDGMAIVGEAGDGRTAIELAKALNPDLVLMDISMPEVNGLAATATLVRIMPEVKILILTRHTDNAYLQEMIEAGASGYILKQSAPTELLRAIKHIAEGGVYLDPALTEKMFAGFGPNQGSPLGDAGGKGLTSRESETLRYTALGYSNKEIAEKFDVSVKTVEAHKAGALKKLGITNRRGIIEFAVRQGWMLNT